MISNSSDFVSSITGKFETHSRTRTNAQGSQRDVTALLGYSNSEEKHKTAYQTVSGELVPLSKASKALNVASIDKVNKSYEQFKRHTFKVTPNLTRSAQRAIDLYTDNVSQDDKNRFTQIMGIDVFA